MYTYTYTHSHVHITNTYRYAHTNAEKNIHAIAHTYLCTFITGYEKNERQNILIIYMLKQDRYTNDR